MAVKNKETPQFVKDFWPRFSAKTATLSLILSLGSLIPMAITLYVSGIFGSNIMLAVILLFVQFVSVYLLLFAFAAFATRPTKYLLSALTFVTGERDGSTPPNANETRFKKTGLSAAIEAIYSAFSQEVVASSTTLDTTQKSLGVVLDTLTSGVVAFNESRTITYSNKAAPVTLTSDGVATLTLNFRPDNALEEWWDECEETTVHAEKTWYRVQGTQTESKERILYDVIAAYNKGAEDEVVLTIVNRSEDYSPSEDALDFIAFAAHELRGPITVIRGYLDVLQDELEDVLRDEQKELFHRLTVSANRLSTYINNILNTSKYDRRQLGVQLKQTSVAAAYAIVANDMSLRAQAHRRLLTVSIPDTLPMIAADTGSLSEVFANLIDNAIKYSNEGGAISVTAVSKGDTIEIAVKDQGIGMPANVISNLFQKFYRSHRSRETVAGTGIGLYISKAMVEAHGGTIAVTSEDGHGSTFTVILPTYDSVAEKLHSGETDGKELLGDGKSWIKNHAMYRG